MILGPNKEFSLVWRTLYISAKFESPVHQYCTSTILAVVPSVLWQLTGYQEEHPVCKNWVMRCWCGYLYTARCRFFGYGPADATASQNHLLPRLNPDWFYLSGTSLLTRSVAGPMAWNSLPDFIRDPTSSTDCFRRLLKMHLFAHY